LYQLVNILNGADCLNAEASAPSASEVSVHSSEWPSSHDTRRVSPLTAYVPVSVLEAPVDW
jgi:hypothetical protein